MLKIKEELYDNFMENKDEWYVKKHAVKVQNNIYKDVITTKWVEDRLTKKMKPVNIDESNVFGYLTDEIMSLMNNELYKEYEITGSEIESIYNMMNFVIAKDINVKIFKKYDLDIEWKYELLTNIEVVDLNFKRDLAEFIQSMQGFNRKILLTSATFPKYNFKDLFYYDTNIQDIMFGENGDPMNANSRMTIFCDSKRYHAFGRNSIKNNIGEIIEECNNVMDIFGSENCLIVCKNILESNMFKKEYEKTETETETKYNPKISYYRSSDLIGVRSNYRVMILIGLGYIPSDAYDSAYDSYYARTLAEENMHCDSWQAISRAKDPEGKEPSVVFAIGCTKYEIDNVVSWGEGREINIGKPVNGKITDKHINISGDEVSKPNVYDTGNWNETIIQSHIHMFGLSETNTISSYKCNNLISYSRFS